MKSNPKREAISRIGPLRAASYQNIRSIISYIAVDIFWHWLCTIPLGSRSNTWLIVLWQRKEGARPWSGEITFPPASEREARMDDPNDSVSPRPGHGTRLSGLPIPSGGPFFSRSRAVVQKLQRPASSSSLALQQGCSPFAARARLPSPSAAKHRIRTAASSFFRPAGISAGRTCWRKKPVSVAAPAVEETAIRTSCS